MVIERDGDGSVALATLGSRLRATLVDLALCAMTSSILMKVAFASVVESMSKVDAQLVGVGVFAVLLGIYEIGMVGANGKTLGNVVTKTAVVHEDDLSPATFIQAFIRFVLGPLVFCAGAAIIWLSPMWVLAVVGYVGVDLSLAVASASVQTLHDRAARTVVVVAS